MKNISVLLVTFCVLACLSSCSVFSVLNNETIYLQQQDSLNTSLKIANIEHYLIKTEIPDAKLNEQVIYKFTVLDTLTNRIVKNSKITLLISKKIKHRHRRTYHPEKYIQVAKLNSYVTAENDLLFDYSFSKAGIYKLNFAITSIEGKAFEKVSNIVTYSSVK